MAKIRTVLGDKSPAEMGHILPHEHTFFHLLGAPSDPAAVFDREKAVEEGRPSSRPLVRSSGFPASSTGRPMTLAETWA